MNTDPTIQIALSCMEALVSAAQKSAGSWTEAERNAVAEAEGGDPEATGLSEG